MLAWSLFAVWAANSSKTFLQLPTLEKGCHRALDHRSPEAVLDLKPLIVDMLEKVIMLVDQTPQAGKNELLAVPEFFQEFVCILITGGLSEAHGTVRRTVQLS
jgi:hypothetical protein